MIANIQSLRGMAAMLVVLFHLASLEANYGHGYRLLPDAWAIGMSGVDLFFVISGFVMVTVTRWRFGLSGEPLRFLLRRATRIYSLYWFFSLLVLAVFLIGPGLVKRSLQDGGVDLVSSFLLLPQEGLPMLMAGWTLVHEMYFYLVFTLLLLFPKRLLGRLLAGWAVAVVYTSLTIPAAGNATLRLISHPLTLEFIAGGFAALSVHRHSPQTTARCLLAGIVLWLAGYLLHIGLGYSLEPSGWLRVLVFGMPATLVVHGLAALEIDSGWTLPAWSVRLGDASYSLYLSHVLVMGALARVGTALPQAGDPAWRPALLIMLVAAATGFAILCHRHVEIPLLRTSRSVLR